jgi:hypothetical protein
MARSVLVIAFVLVTACVPPGPAVAVHSAIVPLLGPCPLDASAGSEFTAEATSLRLTVSGDGITAPLANEGNVGELSIESVPVGVDRVVGLFGLVGTAPLWRGVARGVTVERDVPTAIDVLMTRVGDITCSRGADADKRAFHTATVLDDGSILVIGGAKTSTSQSAICADCRRLEGTTSASIYDPRTGSFSSTGPLAFPRLFHTATKLSDGRVVVIGGARSALVHTADAHPFPILPTDPVNAVEVFDPGSKTFANVAVDPVAPRVFAAATRTLDDEVMVTGGIPFNLPRNDLSNALASTTICGGAALACRAGPEMNSRRAGHVAFTLEPDGIFVMGGSIESGAGQFQVEALRNGAAFEYLEVQSMGTDRNVFFAATTQYVPFRLLSAGGLHRSADGTFELARTAAGGGPVIVLDMSIGAFGGIVTGEPPNPAAMATQSARFFGAAAALPGGTRAIIAGGFSDLGFTPSAELEKYEQATLLVEPLVVQAQPRVLHQARGGLVAAQNGDGAVVFFGGETPDIAGRVPLETAEIFSDPITPPGVAE